MKTLQSYKLPLVASYLKHPKVSMDFELRLKEYQRLKKMKTKPVKSILQNKEG